MNSENRLHFPEEQLEKNGIAFFKGKMINGHAWKTDDAEWMAERKRQWEHIRRKMEYRETPKRKLKQYEKYFLTGRVPRSHPFEDEPAICMFYLIWWHPDQSDENWHEIRETIRYVGEDVKLFDEYPIFWTQHYNESKTEFLVGAGRWGNMAPDEGFPGGFMDGLEERMLNFLVDVDKMECFIYGMNPALWLKNPDERHNPHALYQYDKLINRWYDCLSSGALDRYIDGGAMQMNVEMFFDAVARFSLEQRPPDHFKSVFVRKMRNILDNKPISEKFRALWLQAKQAAAQENTAE